jgi:DNA-directed RNA polymerase subunit M/transcription elongation factor TFIIS
MVKKQMKCEHCAKPYFANVINVYVVKQRFCPDCKNTLTVYQDSLICKKCGYSIKRSDTMAVSGLGVKVVDATTDYHKRDEYALQGLEVEKKLEVEKQLCIRCSNTRKQIENVLQKEVGISKELMKKVKSLSDIEFYQDFYSHYQPMIQRMMFERAVRDGKIKLPPKQEPKGVPVKVKQLTSGEHKNA